MGKQFYIADWHYDHANCIAFDNRPFKSVNEMNEALIERWNNVVSDDDVVYILGDMFWCNWRDALPVLDQLHGRKILIKGNHDRCNESQFVKKFSKIVDYFLSSYVAGRTPAPCTMCNPLIKWHYLISEAEEKHYKRHRDNDDRRHHRGDVLSSEAVLAYLLNTV